MTIGGVAQHLISYYKVEDVEQGRLRSPSTLPELASLDISPEYLDKTHFRNPPKVEIGVDGIPRYRGEADEPDPSPILSTPLLLPSPDDEPSSSKRGKRYDPYGAPTAPKRSRKKQSNALASRSQESGGEESSSPTYPTPIHTSPPSYPETGSLSATTNPHYTSYGNYYSSYPQYGSAYPPAPTSASYPPAPVSPMPPQQTPTPPPAPQPTQSQLTYPGYGDTTHAAGAGSYSYYPQAAQHSYGSYPAVWPNAGYSSYAHAPGVHHQSSGDSHDGLHKEDREEVDSAA